MYYPVSSPQTTPSDQYTNTHSVLVFSHLRFEFVTQRPQHIINRLAKDHRVLFVEEPIKYSKKNENTFRKKYLSNGVLILQPQISWQNYQQKTAQLLKPYLQELDVDPILWFYTGAFSPVLDVLEHALVVFDCMDELTQFKGASSELIKQERRLIQNADVVFTGGRSLHAAKSKLHLNAHCFPSSVDLKHFAKARDTHTKLPKDLQKIPGPIVGFYGVIDERLDLDLMREVAQKAPDISFVYIGPVVKINQKDLPVLPNITYLGTKKYQVLPKYLRGFDVTFMPFALNAATEFISPTKTLEFMAALKPIVSTRISDVKSEYDQEVFLIDTAKQAVNAIRYYLKESSFQKHTRLAKFEQVLKKTSWDNTVQKMQLLLIDALITKQQLQYTKSSEVEPALFPSINLDQSL